jgi:hypothetical protein
MGRGELERLLRIGFSAIRLVLSVLTKAIFRVLADSHVLPINKWKVFVTIVHIVSPQGISDSIDEHPSIPNCVRIHPATGLLRSR